MTIDKAKEVESLYWRIDTLKKIIDGITKADVLDEDSARWIMSDFKRLYKNTYIKNAEIFKDSFLGCLLDDLSIVEKKLEAI